MIAMSKHQGFAGKAMNAAYHANAIKNIIRAFMQGGWAAAALQGLKYYWPQILCVALVLILIPLLIVCYMPMVMFGFEGSQDPKITEMNAMAKDVGEYFENYDRYCSDRTDQINTEIELYVNDGYYLVEEGEYMPKNWFIALFSVSVGNDLIGVTEQQIVDFVNACNFYEIVISENQEEESANVTKKIIIKHLTADEAMEHLNFSDTDKNWATLMFNTLESEETDGYNSVYSN